eukprot:2096062-Rhodomonas_salina.1
MARTWRLSGSHPLCYCPFTSTPTKYSPCPAHIHHRESFPDSDSPLCCAPPADSSQMREL